MEFKKRGMAVFGALTILGSAALATVTATTLTSNTTTLQGTTTISGQVVTTSTPREVYKERASTSTSQVMMSEANGDSRPRVMTEVGFAFATATTVGGGSVRAVIGLGTTANATGSTVLYDGTVTVPTNGKFAISTTSSLMTAYSIWHPGEYLTCMLASPTTTIVTKCFGVFM